jgi:hypothetical protein
MSFEKTGLCQQAVEELEKPVRFIMENIGHNILI